MKISDYENVDVYGKSTNLKDVGGSSPAYVTENNKVSNYEVGRVPHYEDEYNLAADEPYGKHVPEAMEFQLIYGGDYKATRKLLKDEMRRNFKKNFGRCMGVSFARSCTSLHSQC